jgi:hypothetical protein
MILRSAIVIYCIVVLAAAGVAVSYFPYPLAWIIGLTISIPVFAAIAGATLKANR